MRSSTSKIFKHWGSRIREIVFGIQDGLVSTLGVLTGIAKGTEDHHTVVVSGLVIVLVESLSMAAGSYLSSKSNRQYQELLLDNEKKEIKSDLENEKKEIVEMYRSRGYTDREIAMIKGRLLKDKKLLLEDMAHKELGIVPQSFEKPLWNAAFMGISYVIGGILPVLPYLLSHDLTLSMLASFLVTASALFTLGAIKGHLLKVGWLRSGLEILLVAGGATFLGYAVGSLLSKNHLGFK